MTRPHATPQCFSTTCSCLRCPSSNVEKPMMMRTQERSTRFYSRSFKYGTARYCTSSMPSNTAQQLEKHHLSSKKRGSTCDCTSSMTSQELMARPSDPPAQRALQQLLCLMNWLQLSHGPRRGRGRLDPSRAESASGGGRFCRYRNRRHGGGESESGGGSSARRAASCDGPGPGCGSCSCSCSYSRCERAGACPCPCCDCDCDCGC